MLAMAGPMETSTTPGRSRKLFRGQHFAELVAMGTMGTPLAIASRAAPLL